MTPQQQNLDNKLNKYRAKAEVKGNKVQMLTLGGELMFLRDEKVIKVDGTLNKDMRTLSDCPHFSIINRERYKNWLIEKRELDFEKSKPQYAKDQQIKSYKE